MSKLEMIIQDGSSKGTSAHEGSSKGIFLHSVDIAIQILDPQVFNTLVYSRKGSKINGNLLIDWPVV